MCELEDLISTIVGPSPIIGSSDVLFSLNRCNFEPSVTNNSSLNAIILLKFRPKKYESQRAELINKSLPISAAKIPFSVAAYILSLYITVAFIFIDAEFSPIK